MVALAVIDDRDITITPVFKWMDIENVPKSEAAGLAVMEPHEVVEVRFAGSKNYSPIFPTGAFWKREGNQVITYAERWPDQYRAFKEGNPQEANGTPLEMLRTYNVTPEQLSLCRALRVYSIESLNRLEGSAIKSLGMHANALRDAARAFLADRDKGATALGEVELLRAELAALRASMVPAVDSTPAGIEAALKAADDTFGDLSDNDLKDEIAKLNDGMRPRGNPSRATLVQSLQTLRAA
ncbi:MAG: hypothetical protein ACRYGI_11395 [Janthinobacterium lividum]